MPLFSYLKYLTKLRWSNRVHCPCCNSSRIGQPKGKRYYCLDCRNRFLLLTGTYLAWCKIKPQALISAVKLFVLGLSALETSKELNLNYKTVLSLFDTIRLAIFHHNSDVEVIPNVSSSVLRKIVKEKVKKGSKVYTDQFRSYSSLVINGYEHIKVDKEKTFANGKTHINTIESFWAYAKENLAKFHGIKPEKLYLYLKELEFRF